MRRYDRAQQPDGRVTRAHQEDSCQALAIMPDAQRGRSKYEEHGGPTLHQIAELLAHHAADPGAELRALVRLVAFTSIVRNADAHGKNISFLYNEIGRPRLAPAYDTVPTALWPKLRADSAMIVNGRREWDEITSDAIVAEAARWGLRENATTEVMAETMERARASARTLDHHQVAELVESNAQAFLDQIASS